MDEPTMKSCNVQINYSATDGFSSKAAFSSKRSGEASKCMVAVADEVARLAELFGFGDEVEAAVADARDRVRAWRESRSEEATL